VSSADGLERGIQTKQTQFAVCVPSRREAARREQARRVNASRRDRFAASAATYFARVGKVGKPRTPLRETPPRCLYQCFRRAKSERSCDFFRDTLPLLPSKYGGAAQFNFRACSCKLWWPVVNVGAGLCARPLCALNHNLSHSAKQKAPGQRSFLSISIDPPSR